MDTLDLNDNLARVKEIDAEMEELRAERARLTTRLATRVKGQTGKFTLPAGSFTLSENNVYSEDVMRSLLSPGQVKRCTVPKLDKAVVKRLYPEVYAAAKENRGHKVSIS